ncbi:MAG TPA: M3 family metallopeptidase [Polyangiaceae bacterium]|nr:M3 family metallopeptidase [Polyangiaceae bacterium]
MTNATAASYLDALDERYAALHTAKEDAFWSAKMGLGADAARAQRELDARDLALQQFLQAADQLTRLRELRIENDAQRLRVEGWLRTFGAHTIDSSEGAVLAEELAADDGRLQVARAGMKLGFQDANGGFVAASSITLSHLLQNDQDEARRQAAFDGLRSIESHVLERGYLQIVAKRNELGRTLGAEDYYDWKAKRIEGMGKAELFVLLDELEERTRPAARAFVADAQRKHGGRASKPWNLGQLTSGEVTRDLDPYFSFRSAIDRWGRSFAGLGIRYAGAELVLDLLDRPGKYENGFMHGPVVAWRRAGQRIPARVQFTANALPGAVGAGQQALRTLFHEGGHAAHFANIDMPSPCFGQEFAPTSTAFAETQSMFLDSLPSDADWQQRYALDRNGNPMPLSLVERSVDSHQPKAAWVMRSMLSVCYAEKAIYELPSSELTAENVLRVVREVEQRLLFLQGGSPRPTLSISHLISGDFSCTYHGYVLAQMAVAQARSYFLARDGHLVDNHRIGPELARVWWQPGNSISFADFVRKLTGNDLSAAPLAARLNQTAEQRKADEHASVAKLAQIPQPGQEIDLDARIRVVHGSQLVAEYRGDFAKFAAEFAAWIDTRAKASTARANA